MKKERIKLLAVIAGAVLFNLIFWQEKMAVNTILYDVFILAMLFFLYPEARRVSTVRWLTLGHLFCLAMILVQNTLLSKIGFSITLVLLAGFIEYVHRSVWFAGGSMLINGVFVTVSVMESAERKTNGSKKKWNGKIVRFAIIPLVLVLIFFFIYSSANSVFSDYTSRISSSISTFFNDLFKLFSIPRLMFLLAGSYLTAWIIMRSRLNYFEKKESNCEDDLVRKRKSTAEKKNDVFYNLSTGVMGKMAKGNLALKNMNTIGLISLVLLNVLLAVINVIDVRYIWFGFEYGSDVNLFKMIHEGTDLLIISILLAIAVLMVFFRGNLNFYKANKWLKYGAYAWIVQNAILVISVLLRDYYYINKTGLAYKRIGVLFYLALVLAGLASVFWKIYRKKTTYFLFRVNAWAVIVLLVASTAINWDEFIAEYNFSRNKEILMPVDYMVTLSNKALPLLDQNREVLKEQAAKQITFYGYLSPTCEGCFLGELDRRQKQYLEQQQGYTWLSYNMADASIKKYFEQKRKLTAK
ncbi:MAG: DUF4173 domain-containing protein [Chitinophagaceae bacterium]